VEVILRTALALTVAAVLAAPSGAVPGFPHLAAWPQLVSCSLVVSPRVGQPTSDFQFSGKWPRGSKTIEITIQRLSRGHWRKWSRIWVTLAPAHLAFSDAPFHQRAPVPGEPQPDPLPIGRYRGIAHGEADTGCVAVAPFKVVT